MADYQTSIPGLSVTNNRIDALMADFSGMKNLEKRVDAILRKLALRDNVNQQMNMVHRGDMSRENFDGWMAELVRVEMGKTLAILRANAVKKARDAGAGSAATAIYRRTYKKEYTENLNIASPSRRISSRTRIVPPPDGGKSGIHRNRTVSKRTQKLRGYYGPDRSFVLRVLEGGRDVYYATPEGPTGRGSKATYGKRGAMGPRNFFFHQMKGDMEQAAQRLGYTLVGAVEKWVEQHFTDENTK